MKRALVLAGLVTGLGACGGGGASPGPEHTWSLALHDLDEALLSVWIGAHDDAIVVGGVEDRGMILTLDDDAWHEQLLPPGVPLLWGVWALPGGVAIAAGEDGVVLRRDEDLWIRQPTEELVPIGTRLFGAWGSGPDDIWVVGGSLRGVADPGVVLHWDGVTWSRDPDPELARGLRFKVWGAAADDVFVVGEEGFVSHWDGAAWSTQETGVTGRLLAVRGRNGDDVFAVGGDEGGVIAHWDGAAWSTIHETRQPLTSVSIVEQQVLVTGMRGTLIEASIDAHGDVHDLVETIPDPLIDFHAGGAVAGLKLAVGADLLYGRAPTWHGVLACDTPVPETIARGLDAAPADAPALPPDAGDASPFDGTPLPGPGEDCLLPPAFPNCQPGLECWLFLSVGQAVCTKPCDSASECGEYAPACCERPGAQTLETVCMPESRGNCGTVPPVVDASPAP